MSIANVVPAGVLLAASLTLAAPVVAGERLDSHHPAPAHDHTQRLEAPSRDLHGHGAHGDAHDHGGHDEGHDGHRWEAPSEAAERDNPHAASAESIRMGREIYRAQCLVCHGASGAGDGVGADALESRPADLQVHAAGHAAGEYHWVVREGVGEMPGFSATLSGDEIWHVVNYVRHELVDADDGQPDRHDGDRDEGHAPDVHRDHDGGGHHGHSH